MQHRHLYNCVSFPIHPDNRAINEQITSLGFRFYAYSCIFIESRILTYARIVCINENTIFGFFVQGIRVNAVAPGITLTDMIKAVPKEVIDPLIKQIPLRRLGQPEDIANAFVFLASYEASYITGVVLSVDGMART